MSWEYGNPMRRIETYMGITNSNGEFAITYASPFHVTPDIQPQTQAGNANQAFLIVSTTATGFTVKLVQRDSANISSSDVLLASFTPVASASISVLVTARE